MKWKLVFLCTLLAPFAFAAPILISDGDYTVKPKDNNATLHQIGDRIQKTSAISSSSLGDESIWEYLLEALLVGEEIYTEMELYNIKLHYSDDGGNVELMVTGQTEVWNQTDIQVAFVICFIDDSLAVALQFSYNGTKIPWEIWPEIGNYSAWFSGLTLIGINSVSVSTTTFEDNNGNQFTAGLRLVAHAQTNEKIPIQDDLYALIHGSSKNRIPITGTLVGQFPLSEDQPFTSWTLTIDGTIYFSSPNVVSNNVVLSFQLTAMSADIDFSCDVTISNLGGKGNPPVTFAIQSSVSTSSFFTFQGTLVGQWVKPFGVTWATFNNLQMNFDFNPLQSPTIASLTFNGGLSLLFSNSTQPVTVNFDTEIATDCLQVMLDVDVPAVDLNLLFDETLNGNKPLMLDQLTISGDVNFVLATYNGQYMEGFTISGNVDVSQTGAISEAIRAVQTPQSWTYQFQLYVPLFSTQPEDINFYLIETGPIPLTQTLTMKGYEIQFDLNPVPSVLLSTTINWVTQTENILWGASAKVTVGNNQDTLALAGSMEGTWNHPWGLKWLSLTNVQASLTLSNADVQAFSFQGIANISFGALNGATVNIIIPGPDFSQFSFSLTVFISDMSVFLKEVSPGDVKIVKQFSQASLTGTLIVSTFPHDNVQAGITVGGNVLLLPTGSVGAAINSFEPNSPLYFTVNLVLPIFSQEPWDIDFSLTEQGTYQLTKSITINSVEVSFEISSTPSVSIFADSIVKWKSNPTPFHIVFGGDINADDIAFSVMGFIQGNWLPYPDIQWVTATSAAAVLTFADNELQTFSINGTCNITAIGNTAVTFVLYTANDFFDSYIELETYSILNLGQFIKAVSNITIPPVFDNLIYVTNDFEIILSTFDDGDIRAGLTFQDTVTINGKLLEQLKIFDQFGDVKSATYGVGITVPVFPEDSLNFDIELNTDQPIRIKENMLMTHLDLLIETNVADIELEFAVNTTLLVNFTDNPELEFDVAGSFGDEGTLSIYGDMLGTWDNMFGIKGVDISNVVIGIGFNPALCTTLACLQSFGLGYNLTIGYEVIAFYGSVNIPNIWDIFLEAEVGNKDGYAFTLVDLAIEWNDLIGNSIGLPIQTGDIPADWGFKNTYLYIAPESGDFGGIYYQQGFWIDGGFNMFGIEVLVDIKVTDDDFSFEVSINTTEFQFFLQKELDLLNEPDHKIVSVHSVNVTELTLSNYAHGQDTKFKMNYDFLGGNHDAHIDVPLLGLYGDFHDFFVNYLEGLFD